MSFNTIIALLLLASLLLTMVVVRFVSRLGTWNSYVRTALGYIVFPLILGALFFIVFLGPAMPIEAWFNRWKVATLERHLSVGEPRVALERQMGKAIPMPDLRTCCGTEPSQDRPASGKGRERYYYLVSGSMCIAAYRGIAVRFDRRDRVKSWRRVALADGC